MSRTGKKLIYAAEEAIAVARGKKPAARIFVDGYAYVQGDEVTRLREENERLKEALAEIERLYWREAKEAGWRASQMKATARKALEGK
jgi:hypothetical protein